MFRKINILMLFLASANLLFADTLDIEPPMIKLLNENCGYFEFTVSDKSEYKIDSLNYHLDGGLSDKPFMSDIRNFPDTVRVFNFDTNNPNKEFTISLEAINKYDTASAIIYAADIYDEKTGKRNIGNIKVQYIPKIVSYFPDAIAFGAKNVGGNYNAFFRLESQYLMGLSIYNLKLSSGSLYQIKNKPSNPFFLKKDSIFQVDIEYKPLYDNYSVGKFDYDTLSFETECLKYAIPISGQGAIPKIIADDFYFGTANIGEEKCAMDITSNSDKYGLFIRNVGTGQLAITGIYLKNGTHFKLKNINLPIGFDIELNPGQVYELRDICFEPKSDGELVDTLVIISNAETYDNQIILRGIGVKPGPYFSELDFGDLRVGDSKSEYLEIKNNDDKPLLIKNFMIDNSSEFTINYDNIQPKIDNGILLYPENSNIESATKIIYVPIVFHPNSEYSKMSRIIPVFEDTLQYDNKKIFNYIQGYGFLPKYSASGYDFTGKTLVNTKHNEMGMVRIYNTSQSAELQIKSISADNAIPDAPDDFTFPVPLPQNFIILPEHFYDIYFEFFPKTSGFRKMLIEVEHDGYAGSKDSSVVDIIEVTGVAYNKVISTSQYFFRSVLNCALDTGLIRIFNISDTTNATIIRTEFISGDIEAFRILNNFYDEKVILKPGNDYDLIVEFNPSALNSKSDYEAFAKVYSDVDTSVVIVSGNTFKLPAVLDISDISGLAPGQLTKREMPDEPFKPLNVTLSSNSAFDSLNINKMKLEIAYKPKQLLFQNDFLPGDILKDWENVLVYTKIVNQDSAVLTAEIYDSQKVLQTGGILFNPVFEILLGDTNDISLKFVNAEFGNSENCISETLLDGSIELSYCGDEMSKIYFSLNNYGLNSIIPNPVSTGSFTVKYSVALSGKTDISIYNSTGIIVKSVVSGFLNEGIYEANIDAEGLSSGVYFIKMQSGPFLKTIPLLIVK